MKFSRKTDYGVILLQELRPSFYSGKFKSLAKIAKENHLPLPFLEKLADVLRKDGVLEAKRGSEGGYRLARDPRKTTLKELIDILEEPPMMRCMKSNNPQKHCSLAAFCPARKGWMSIHNKVTGIFEKVTLAEI